jgi:transposase
MDARANAHDASVHMIHTSIVYAHQQGACIIRNRNQSRGRSRDRLTSKTHVVVEADCLCGLLTAGEGARQPARWRTFRRDASAPSQSASARISIEPETLSKRFVNTIKHCRRVAARYNKLAANYLVFVQPASIRLWLCANESAF